jgi:hypothetical protein
LTPVFFTLRLTVAADVGEAVAEADDEEDAVGSSAAASPEPEPPDCEEHPVAITPTARRPAMVAA